jgi:hypothetical protein
LLRMGTVKNSKYRLVASGPISAMSAGTCKDPALTRPKAVSVIGAEDYPECAKMTIEIMIHKGRYVSLYILRGLLFDVTLRIIWHNFLRAIWHNDDV